MSAASKIAKALGGHRIAKDEYRCKCPAHEDSDPSLDVRDRADGSVLVICRSGCNQIDVINELKRRNLWPDVNHTNSDFVGREIYEAEAKRMSEFALRIWSEARDPSHTLAEQYLVERGLMLPASLVDTVVRFHPRCPRKGSTAPALIALMRSYKTREPVAIQRIYINPRTLKKD